MRTVVEILSFLGLPVAALAGLMTSWVDRKVTARVQMRRGPPFLQPFYDVLKYFIKETLVPQGGGRVVFLGAPLLGFAGAAAASTILWRTLLTGHGFVGDVIVVLYLLTLPALSVILGAFASRNPLASLGGSREMKLMLAYELPLIVSVLVPVARAGSIRLEVIMQGTVHSGPSGAGVAAGLLAAGVGILCTQAKLGLAPFDLAEAETELSGGALIEYSGPPLGIYYLTQAMMLFTMPLFLICVFGGGLVSRSGIGALLGVVMYLVIVVLLVLIRNTAVRVRIDQAIRFFWGPVFIVALAALALAVRG